MSITSALDFLPKGGGLPAVEWQRRHRALMLLLWLSIAVLVFYAAFLSYPTSHVLEHLGAMLPLALFASSGRLSRRARSVSCAFGLLTACAVAVHTSGGLIEAHFAFFVVVAALTLYEDWTVFALAVGFTLLHHGVLGTFAPKQVFHEPEQWADPWKWATIHALFVGAAGVAGVIAWRLNEDVRHRMLETQEQLNAQARTDALTGLANRRQLLGDLDAAMLEPGTRLAIFDLDGFKGYNDSFGHQAGDELLMRLGGRLATAVEGVGTAYRLGGDEFCLLLRPEAPARTMADAVQALSESGEAFAVRSSHGDVGLEETPTAGAALVLADRRMYAAKDGGRRSASRQSTDVLLGALGARTPDLVEHVSGVAAAAVEVGLEMGLHGERLATLAQAAELHDIGKVAIPQAILDKTGPLNEEEWAFMRRHTVIGERIIAAAPALAAVAKLVRFSHERWDGTGYPDGASGEAIPLGSRIVAVCDAFDAMVADRPYRAALSEEAALAELDRCAGSQFDRAVVAAFEKVAARRHEPVAFEVPALA